MMVEAEGAALFRPTLTPMILSKYQMTGRCAGNITSSLYGLKRRLWVRARNSARASCRCSSRR
jgi:hypothetical protein